jgi:hypothetical protein
MPFKSQAQRRKFYAMASRGEMSPKTVRKWETETVGPLPERLSKTSMIMDAFADEMEKQARHPFLAAPSKIQMLIAALAGTGLGFGGVAALGDAARHKYPEQFAEDSWGRPGSNSAGGSIPPALRGAIGGATLGGLEGGPIGAALGAPIGMAAGAGIGIGAHRAQPLLWPNTKE